jgi:hypothetical protein
VGTAAAELELAVAIHGGSGHEGALKRGREQRRESGREHGASRSGSASMTREEEAGHAVRRWGAKPGMVATQGRTCRPFAQFLEHVVCVKLPDLEVVFGPSSGQIWTWAQRQSRSPCKDLQLSLRHLDH